MNSQFSNNFFKLIADFYFLNAAKDQGTKVFKVFLAFSKNLSGINPTIRWDTQKYANILNYSIKDETLH